MDNNPPPPPYYSGTFNDPGNPTKEGIPVFTPPPYPPPPPAQSYIIGVGSLPNNGQQQPSNISPPPPPPVMTRPIHVFTPKFGPYPLEMDCPHCRSHIVTQTIKTPGVLPWIIMGVCFVIGFFLLLLGVFVVCLSALIPAWMLNTYVLPAKNLWEGFLEFEKKFFLEEFWVNRYLKIFFLKS
uniref:LITAF domain-containing protein n=1 Tax=Meloidogyne enterolobii TaxID=390850 RepID=A0A6V7X565_MELEN|nr:unnamed protein product [Meloidogyne enterolobii]